MTLKLESELKKLTIDANKYANFTPSKLQTDFPYIYKNRQVLLAETQAKREEKVNRLCTQAYN